MSFMGGGGECSSAGNPLSQFQKHVQGSGSGLAQDHLANRPANGAADFRSTPDQGATQDEAFMHAMATNPPNLHLDPAAQGVHLRASSASPHWAGPAPAPMHPTALQYPTQAAMEAAFKTPGAAPANFSPQDFVKFQAMQQSAPGAAQQMNAPAATAMPSSAMHRPMMGMGMMNMGSLGMGGMGMMQRPMYQPGMMQQHQAPDTAASMDKGKGKAVVELDDHQWEEQFKQISLEEQKSQEDEARAMEPELNKMDEKLAQHSETNYGDFESIWRGIQAENETGSGDFSIVEDQFKNGDFDGWDTFDGPAGGSTLRDLQGPMVEEYLYEEDNLFKETSDPFAEGLRIMNDGGNLSLAALAFEAAVQKNPDHADAWVHLGHAQAQNEKETAAIRALEQALKLDPSNLAALMGLAVSYINEGYETTAYRTLERWLSVKYPQVVSPDNLTPIGDVGFTDRQQLHDRITDFYIKAAQLGPGGAAGGANMDPDVQVGLGVLFYGAEEYEKAVDCFAAALASSEQGTVNESSQVHLLWNRLGATLANSGRSEEAINAYEKALSINPNFVRARYNLGVSCINIGCHAEAAGHLLSALAMHKSVEREGRERAREILRDANGGGDVDEGELERLTTHNRSTTLYDTLRRVFTQMGRRDLAERVVVGVDPEGFRGEIEF